MADVAGGVSDDGSVAVRLDFPSVHGEIALRICDLISATSDSLNTAEDVAVELKTRFPPP